MKKNKLNFIFVLTILFIQFVFANTVSNLKGNMSVVQGSLNYDVPLVLPVGTAGLKPSVSLSYSSNSLNSYVGVGWDISAGQSVISRCGHNLTYDRKIQGIKYDSSDNICLDSQRLVLVSGSKWEYDSEYKTKIDTYSKIVYRDNKFYVYSKDGDIREYHKYNDVWLLKYIKDRYHNTISYNYNSNSLETYLSSIFYADNKIIFNYEDRKDIFSAYLNGKNIKRTRRLSSIYIQSGNKLLRTYNLEYNSQSSSLDKSILKSITECSEGECLRPLTFEVANHKNYDFMDSSLKIKSFGYKAGGWRVAEHPRMLNDMNGDGLVDVVGFANSGVYISYNNGDGTFTSSSLKIKSFGYDSEWRVSKHPRMLNDMNADGLIDVVGFFDNGVYISYNNGDGTFTSSSLKIKSFGYKAGGWKVTEHPRMLEDMNGDGLVDVVGFANSGVYISYNNGDGTFTSLENKISEFGKSQGWRTTEHLRMLNDMNADGLIDIVGFFDDGVYISYNNGNGTFTSSSLKIKSFGYKAGGWKVTEHPRMLEDMNGDGLVDVVGFANKGVYISYNNGDGTFTSSSLKIKSFGYDSEWRVSKHPRMLNDMNADGLIDVVGFFDNGVYISYNNGDGTFTSSSLKIKSFGYKAGGWKVTEHPRMLEDMNGDGLVDVVGFFNDGVYISTFNFIDTNITKITDSFGNIVKINYKRLNDKSNSIYKKYSDSKYPNIDIASSLLLVESITSKGSNNATLKTSYKYEGLKANLRGLGSLGFSKIVTKEHLNNSETFFTYRQDFPYVGLLGNTYSYLDDELISKTYYEYSNKKYGKDIYQIRNYEKVNFEYDGGDLLKIHAFENKNYDNYGNILEIIETIIDDRKQDKFTTYTNNTFENYPYSWILGRLTKSTVISEAYGDRKEKTSSFTYDDTTGSLLTETIEPNSDKWLRKSYSYDSFGNKIKETINGADIPYNITTMKYYDSLGKFIREIKNPLGHSVRRIYNEDGQVTGMLDENEIETTWKYDNFGKKIKEYRADGTSTTYDYTWDSSFNSLYKITITNSGSKPVSMYYNKLGQNTRSEKVGFNGNTIWSDIYYNNYGKVYKKSTPYFSDDSPEFSYFYYDKYQRLVKQDDPAPNNQRAIQTIRYDGFTTITQDAMGRGKRVTKNALGLVIYVEEEKGANTRYEYNANKQLIKTIDSKGNEIIIGYDKFGNKIYQNDPDMGEWHYKYNSLGQLVAQRDAKGQVTEIYYDALGRKETEKNNGELSTWIYDKTYIGKLFVEEKKNYAKVHEYDRYGRVSLIYTKIDDMEYEERYIYDEYGRLKEKILPDKFKIKNSYNENGYLESIKSPVSQIKDFDPEHFLRLLRSALSNADDYYAKQREYEYKALKLEDKVKEYKALIKDNKKEKKKILAYIKELEKYIVKYKMYAYENQSMADYYRNKAYELLQKQGRYNPNLTPEYIAKVSKEYMNYVRNYLEKSKKHLKKVKEYKDKKDLNTVKVNNIDKKIDYYTKLVRDTVYECKKAISIAKNYQKRTKANEVLSQYYQEILEDEEHNYFYKVLEQDSFGRVTKYLSGNGLITDKRYSTSGYLEEINTGYSLEDDKIRSLRFVYDNSANLRERYDYKLGVFQGFAYDSLDRITETYTDTRSRSFRAFYAYDELGNIRYNSDIGEYEYSKPHQVSKIGDKTFKYDKNGNMINNNGLNIEYTSYNKVKKLETNQGNVYFYYNPDKVRYKKETRDYVTHYLGKKFELIKYSDGNIELKYFIYVNGKVVSIYTNSTSDNSVSTKYLHYDSLNSVDTITNNLGVVEQRIVYKAFGERILLDEYGNKTSKASFTNRGYTGHEHIEEADLIHMNGRVYDPSIARFISADPNIFHPFDTQDFNRYSYVRNNPLKYIDPSGYGWDDNEYEAGDFDPRDSSADEQSVNQAEENHGGYSLDDVTGDGDGESHSSFDIKENTSEKKIRIDGSVTVLPDVIVTTKVESGLSLLKRFTGKGDGDKTSVITASIKTSGVGVYENATSVLIFNSKRSIIMTRERKKQLDKNIREAKNMSMNNWISAVRNGGRWDYKNKNPILEAYGNLNYGATSNALGLNAVTARAGSFCVQVYNTLSNYNRNQNFINAMNDELANDWQDINLGYDYANTILP